MKKIGMVLDVGRGFPPDIRVEKEARALIRAGFEVCLLAKKACGAQDAYEKLDYGLEVFRADIGRDSFSGRCVTAMTTVRRPWLAAVETFVTRFRPMALHVHDFTMVPTVLQTGRRHGIPVVADLHENMPAAMLAYRSGQPAMQRMKSAILHNYHLMRWREARALKHCARVIVVVPEAAERLYGYGLPVEKITVVSNTEDETTFSFRLGDADPQIVGRYRPYWTVSYIGAAGPHRGLDTALRAVPIARSAIRNLRLLIVGANGDSRRKIDREAAHLGIEGCIEVIGWQPFSKVNSYVMASNVCLVPHNACEHTHTTVPHKLFQYMICRKPVLVSSCRPLARIVNEAKAGMVFAANDSQSLAGCLVQMCRNPAQLEEWGANGQKAALGQYAWRHDADRLTAMYAQLAEEIVHRE